MGEKDYPIAYRYRRKSIGSSSSTSSGVGRFCAIILMRRRTSSGNPRRRVPDVALAPVREGGDFADFALAFAFDVGFELARAGLFTGEGSGCRQGESSARGTSE